jgi:hypothetical protein
VVYRFHVNIFADPKGASFAVTFEEAAAALEQLPRMIFELDGSFVVSGDDAAGRRWQVDGHLFDFAGRLHRYELHGYCPVEAFDGLLRCVGWSDQRLMFETVRAGLSLSEPEFRKHAAADF